MIAIDMSIRSPVKSQKAIADSPLLFLTLPAGTIIEAKSFKLSRSLKVIAKIITVTFKLSQVKVLLMYPVRLKI